jgi:hypothetical protein
MIFSRSSFAAASFENSQPDTSPVAGDNASLTFEPFVHVLSFRAKAPFRRRFWTCAAGRMTISLTSTSAGCSMANAANVSPDLASFMADSQVPWGVEALSGAITQPSWRTKPSWHLVTTEDKMIPPDAQRAMSKRAGSTVVEVKSIHAVYVSHPQVVAHLIEQVATGALATANRKR